MDKTIDMAREVKMPYDFVTGEPIYIEKLKAFEALVRADEREIVMNEPLTKENWQRFEDEIRADERNSWPAEMEAMERQVNILTDALADEREACAKVAEWEPCMTDTPKRIAAAIRARANT